MKIKDKFPQSVKAVLWSYDPNRIDLVKHKKLIIAQVLNYGNKEATDWLFNVYPKDEITRVAATIPVGQWDKKSLALWSLYLDIKPTSRAKKVLHAS